MSGPLSLCANTLQVWCAILATNAVLVAFEVGNFLAGDAFKTCSTRPDYFWRILIFCKLLVVTLGGMFAIYRRRATSLPLVSDLISQISDLAGKFFLALEIGSLLGFSLLLTATFSTCEVRGFWVTSYYWLLATLSFLLSSLLALMWFAAGEHVFGRYDQDLTTNPDFTPYILSIKNAETEQDQRKNYQRYRIAVESTYNAPAFSALDIRFIEKYSTYGVADIGLERALKQLNKRCVECDEEFALGNKIIFLRDCLHISHFSCLVPRLHWSEFCSCGSSIRQAIIEPCFFGPRRQQLTDLLQPQYTTIPT